MPVMNVGLIGAGRMGRPMSRHIMNAGFPLFVYDPVPDAMRTVEGFGAQACLNPRAVAAESDVILVIPGFYEEVFESICGAEGVLAGARPGTVVVVSSTISSVQAEDLARRCAEKGVAFVDAPICQGEIGAIGGYLVWLVGGDEADIARARPVMESCGKEIFHLGKVGAGMVGKAMNNMLLWAALVADHEALAIAERHGVTKERLIPALLRSSGKNWPLENWKDMDKIPWAHKDMQIVLEMGDRAGLTLPIAALLREQVKPLMRAAGTPEDFIR
jgi:3-hydroxyisobutyrate dehydrogenase-like beta-hydroxyacid dehydrogenase